MRKFSPLDLLDAKSAFNDVCGKGRWYSILIDGDRSKATRKSTLCAYLRAQGCCVYEA